MTFVEDCAELNPHQKISVCTALNLHPSTIDETLFDYIRQGLPTADFFQKRWTKTRVGSDLKRGRIVDWILQAWSFDALPSENTRTLKLSKYHFNRIT
jgi:hypothetical protein